jgi:hypothetical protein
MANRKNVGPTITSEIVDDAVARFLAKGGKIQKLGTDNPEQKHVDWMVSDYLTKIREDKEITAEDAVVDTTDYSSSTD